MSSDPDKNPVRSLTSPTALRDGLKARATGRPRYVWRRIPGCLSAIVGFLLLMNSPGMFAGFHIMLDRDEPASSLAAAEAFLAAAFFLLAGVLWIAAAFAWYRASVTAALYSHWRRPILSGLQEPLEVGVAFEIRRDGGVLNPRISLPSGIPSLDRSALRAVADASPLPPLPQKPRRSPAGRMTLPGYCRTAALAG